VGWAMGTTPDAGLVIDALVMAFERRRPDQRVIHHADRGSAYTSLAFGQRLETLGITASFGSTGDCYDCEQNQGLPGRGLTLAYDWPRCLGVDLSAPARWRSTHTPAGREGGDRIGA